MNDEQYQKTGRSMFIIAWVVLFILLFLFFRYYNGKEQGSYQINQGVVTITPDQDGHYFIDGHINGQPIKFLVDTGASLVAIPQPLASRLGLEGRYPVTLKTANGEVTGSLTRLKQLSFADFNLQNIKAVIIPNSPDETVLLGMNVLAKFNLSQENKQLIIKKP